MISLTRRAAAVVAAAFATSVVFASSALAYTSDAGEEAGPGMTVAETVAWFVVAPALISGVIWFLWSIPKWRRAAAPATGDNWNPKPSSDVVSR